MNQTLGRGTIAISYSILAVGAVIALFPLSLMFVSALKTSAEIVANPLDARTRESSRRIPVNSEAVKGRAVFGSDVEALRLGGHAIGEVIR